MSRFWRAVLGVGLLLAVVAPPATAHETPKYQSVFDGIKPAVPGLKAQVLGFDNQYELVDRTGKTVVIYGYKHEPYARILRDGTVEVNQRSPATYLNQDRFGTTPVPASANPNAPPLWKVEDKSGRFTWHDHRMHWMSHGLPPQVKDKHKRSKIFDYSIPLSVDGKPERLTGTLFWRGTPKGIPFAAIVAFVLIAFAALTFVLVVRRRRLRSAGGVSSKEATPSEAKAW
jgi:hypothetical protein